MAARAGLLRHRGEGPGGSRNVGCPETREELWGYGNGEAGGGQFGCVDDLLRQSAHVLLPGCLTTLLPGCLPTCIASTRLHTFPQLRYVHTRHTIHATHTMHTYTKPHLKFSTTHKYIQMKVDKCTRTLTCTCSCTATHPSRHPIHQA